LRWTCKGEPARGKRFAAHFMEADTADIAFADGAFTIAGTDRSMPIEQVAQMSFIPVGLPSELGVGLQGAGGFSSDVPSFPNGCHSCEVEIDPRPARSSSTATPSSTIAAPSLTRYWRRGRSWAGSRKAPAKHSTRMSSTTATAANC
jgi:hypothetical protein